jgi:hypothetical protein
VSYDTIEFQPINSSFVFAPTDSRNWYFLVTSLENDTSGSITIKPTATSYVTPNSVTTVTSNENYSIFKLGNNPGYTGLIQVSFSASISGKFSKKILFSKF